MMEAITLSSHTITMKTNHTEPHNWLQIRSKGLFLEMVAALSIPICLWGLIGNATVFWFLCCKVKRTTFIVYFLNLIIADFIVAAYFLIVFCVFLTSLYVSYYFSHAVEKIYSLARNASIFLLTVICFERYFVVSFPLYYQQHRPKDFTMNMCCIIWFWSFLVALILYAACYPKLSPNNSLCHGALIFESIAQLMFLFPIMFFSALSLFIRMRKRAKQRTESRLDITLTIMVVLSLICIFTFRTLDFISRWARILREPTLFQLSLLFDSIKSSISPLVFFFIGNWQRQNASEPMYKVLERALNDKESKDTPDTS